MGAPVDKPARWAATPTHVALAQAFVLRKWRERHLERNGHSAWAQASLPTTLAHACKFSSLFAHAIFGGRLEGNEAHQFVRLASGDVLDLNHDAPDVQALGAAAHRHDPVWWGNPDHRESMKSCRPRVSAWVAEFSQLHGLTEPAPTTPTPRVRRRSP